MKWRRFNWSNCIGCREARSECQHTELAVVSQWIIRLFPQFIQVPT